MVARKLDWEKDNKNNNRNLDLPRNTKECDYSNIPIVKKKPRKVKRAVVNRKKLEEIALPRKKADVTSKDRKGTAMIAKYNGTCVGCKSKVYKDKEIVFNGRGAYHLYCFDQEYGV